MEELEWIEVRYKRRYVPKEILNDHVKEYTKSPVDYHNEILQEENQIDVDQVKSSSNIIEFMAIHQNLPRHQYRILWYLQLQLETGKRLRFNCFHTRRAIEMERLLEKYKF